MALQDILRKILDEAKKEVTEIEKSVAAQKKVIAEDFSKKELQALEELKEKTNLALSRVEEKTNIMASRENAMDLLEKKQELIKVALDKFLETLENADDKTYGKIISKLFDRITTNSGNIFAPSRRMEITTNNAPQGFKVVPDNAIKGGFIFRSGGLEIDNSFETLVRKEFSSELTSYFSDQFKFAV